MNKMTGPEVLLTSDDIRQWQEELADAERRVVELRKKLEYATFMFGSKFSPSDTPKPKDEPNDESMSDASLRLLGGFQRAVTHSELQTALRAIPKFQAMLDKNNGAYYYTMIRRLVKADPPKIKKAGKKIRLIHKNEAPPEGNPEGAP